MKTTRHCERSVAISLSLAIAGLAAPMFAAERPPIFRAFFGKSTVGGLIPAQNIRPKKIAEHLGRKLLTGMAYTDGKARVELVPSETDARLRLILDLTVSARTTTEVKPRSDIKVSIYTTAITQAHVTKLIIFKPDHFETEPAVVTATTAITLHGASASATGAFAGEKKRQAEAQALSEVRNSLTQKEAETAERNVKEISSSVDSKADTLLKDLTRDYQQIFYVPIFTDSRVPGRPAFYSDADGFRVVVNPPEGPWEELSPLPKLAGDTVLGLNLHQSLLNRKLGNQVAGKVFDEYELEALLIRQGLESNPHDWGNTNDRTFVRFCKEDPFLFTFENDAVDVMMCFQAIHLDGQGWEGGAQLHFQYKLTQPQPGSARLKRGPIFAAQRAELVSDQALNRVQARYQLIFPEQIDIGNMPLPAATDALRDVILSNARIQKGWVTLEWKSDGKN